MLLTATDAGEIALDFLTVEWSLSEVDREWFSIFSSRLIGESWYIVELGLEGLPDKWYIQVYDTGKCDPDYTFMSPLRDSQGYDGLRNLPQLVAEVVCCERNTR